MDIYNASALRAIFVTGEATNAGVNGTVFIRNCNIPGDAADLIEPGLIGNAIKDARGEIGQREFSRRNGLTQSWLSEIENGGIAPTYKSARNIFDKLGKQVLYIALHTVLPPEKDVPINLINIKDYAEIVGIKLRHAREFNGLSTRGLAKVIGSPMSCVSDFELGKQAPKLSTVTRFFKPLGVLVSYCAVQIDRE
jgi:transcriptional regulator with XRE-family HTH domain